jgi:serine/threonine protein kinase
MRVTHIPCGPFANESEQKAVEHLKTRVQSSPGESEWILLSNLIFSVNHQVQSDEIDIVAIGPGGVRIIEVKHWSPQWLKANSANGRLDDSPFICQEADRTTFKARKIGTTLRKHIPRLPRVDAVILLTWKPSEIRFYQNNKVRGVSLYSLDDWKSAVGLEGSSPISAPLSNDEMQRISKILEPRAGVNIDGSLRRFGGFINLELQTAKDERFHRIFYGSRSVQQDRIVLHLYDLSATQEKNAERKARREFEVLHILQQYPWAPRILDSFQDAPGYLGEMYFFSIVDPAAPTVVARAKDQSWDILQRVEFARRAVAALEEMHTAEVDRNGNENTRIVHRNLTKRNIRVRHDGTPVFTEFHLARIPSDVSVASMATPSEDWKETAAPEVQAGGLAAADQRSDIYSLCASLRCLFHEQTIPMAADAVKILEGGTAEFPSERKLLSELASSLGQLLGKSVPVPPPPPARFWSEDQVIRFRDHDYRIVARLGSGGVGTTFKVIELDRITKEELGTYVAKVAHDKERGDSVLRSYNLARSHLTRNSGLSAIYEVAKEWKEDNFLSLMTWIEGVPLSDFAGVFPLLADDLQETGSEALALRWLGELLSALKTLHKNGLIHGDVSPRNIIVSDSSVVLTDYDFVRKINEHISRPGTIAYCSPSCQEKRPASASDDLYALAASFFHVIFDRHPFQYGGDRVKERGINWEGIKREEYPVLSAFLDCATFPEPNCRFQTTIEALVALQAHQQAALDPRPISTMPQNTEPTIPAAGLREEHVDWLSFLLQSYPGSRWGNQETRGLDTPFAAQTYVETGLEDVLFEDICKRRARLVILCGNAGDGKTALLQHLAEKLGFGKHLSSERIIKHRRPDGLIIRINLDGSASWKGRPADELLNEFLEPFQQGTPANDIAHLLAVNDGRLLEWIELFEGQSNGETPLTDELYRLLQEDEVSADSYIRFISLNHRSLVGGVNLARTAIQASFVEQLIERLYGGEQAIEIWKPCLACSAQSRCEVFRALKIFGPGNIPSKQQEEIRGHARERLIEALQAVHMRSEVHITARELRAALVYILFGVHSCEDYHSALEEKYLPYWDRAFDPTAPCRQGEVLHELVHFDPALEAHPQIDRYLLSESGFDSGRTAPRYGGPGMTLSSARRRAFFEWTDKHISEVARDAGALGLARGRNLRLFRELALDAVENTVQKSADVCARLCLGISRLEDLPPQALDRKGVTPLRISPRTPIETAFWVEKPLGAFRLEAELPPASQGIDRLHRQVWLIYHYRDGNEDRLRFSNFRLENCIGGVRKILKN